MGFLPAWDFHPIRGLGPVEVRPKWRALAEVVLPYREYSVVVILRLKEDPVRHTHRLCELVVIGIGPV